MDETPFRARTNASLFVWAGATAQECLDPTRRNGAAKRNGPKISQKLAVLWRVLGLINEATLKKMELHESIFQIFPHKEVSAIMDLLSWFNRFGWGTDNTTVVIPRYDLKLGCEVWMIFIWFGTLGKPRTIF